MSRSTIILLNGASSSGKTSIARVLQQRLEEPFLFAGVDNFRPALPERYFLDSGLLAMDPAEGDLTAQAFYLKTIRDGEACWYEVRSGPIGRRLTRGRRAAIAGLASAGNNVIVDEVLCDQENLEDYVRVLRDYNVLFVGVHCPLPILEQRERERGDRLVGYVRGHAHLVHAHGLYDVEVDTSVATPDECAEQIIRHLSEGPPPDAFARLRARFQRQEEHSEMD